VVLAQTLVVVVVVNIPFRTGNINAPWLTATSCSLHHVFDYPFQIAQLGTTYLQPSTGGLSFTVRLLFVAAPVQRRHVCVITGVFVTHPCLSPGQYSLHRIDNHPGSDASDGALHGLADVGRP
jgi:hypothetical protein